MRCREEDRSPAPPGEALPPAAPEASTEPPMINLL